MVFLMLSFSASIQSLAQVGINNPLPDPSAILDISAIDRGLLIPRLSSGQWQTLNTTRTPANALTIFATDYNMFTFYQSASNAWLSLNPWTLQVPTADLVNPTANLASADMYINPLVGGNVGIGITDPEEKLHVDGNVKATQYKLADGSDLLPVGTIVMWSGDINAIPNGWQLCDGTKGTPDLRNRFIVGAGSGYNPGATGGADRVALTIAEMPAHKHDKGSLNITGGGGHFHTSDGVKLESKQVDEDGWSSNSEAAQNPGTAATISGLGEHAHLSKDFAGEPELLVEPTQALLLTKTDLPTMRSLLS